MSENLAHKKEEPTTGLLALPNEVLERIAKYISDSEPSTVFQLALVHKRLWRITSPSVLLRRWPIRQDNHNHPSLHLLALHLLQNPQLHMHVRDISLTEADVSDSQSPGDIRLNEEESEALSAEMREMAIVMEGASLSENRFEATQGNMAALVLSWTTNITNLEMEVPYLSPEDGNYFLPLRLASDVAKKIIAGGQLQSGALPLITLRHVTVACSDTEANLNGLWTAPLFHLPKLRVFEGRRLYLRGADSEPSFAAGDCSKFLPDFPCGTASIEELLLEDADFTPAGLKALVRSCRRLRRLDISENYVTESADMSTNALAQIILLHKTSLETLNLQLNQWDDCELFEDFDDGPIALEDCLQYLETLTCLTINIRRIRTVGGGWKVFSLGRLPSNLESLSTDIKHIIEEGPSDQGIINVDRLPPSLRFLTLTGLKSRVNFPRYREELACYMEAFRTLLSECRPDYRLSRLKVVHLPVVDHPSIRDLEALKELASVNGVKLSLEHLPRW
ncbi:hypothetical protein ACHAQD_010295 [Fusarium lateritium]